MLDQLSAWLGRHDRVLLAGVFVIVIGTLVFLLLAGRTRAGATQGFDEAVLSGLRCPGDPAVPIGPAWMAEVARDVTALGSYAVLAGVTLTACGFLWLDRRYGAGCLVLTAALGGSALSSLLKACFGRPRPEVVPHLAQVASSSFPSSHAMMSAVVYLTLGALVARLVVERRLKAYCLGVALLLSGIVGLSRVVLGVHYPSDVAAGWTAGVVWATTCWLVARRLSQQGTIRAGS